MAADRKPFVAAVTSGDRGEALAALRDLLAVSLEETPPEKRAPLAKQLVDVLGQLDTLPAKEVSPSDDLRARRAARRADAAAAASAG